MCGHSAIENSGGGLDLKPVVVSDLDGYSQQIEAAVRRGCGVVTPTYKVIDACRYDYPVISFVNGYHSTIPFCCLEAGIHFKAVGVDHLVQIVHTGARKKGHDIRL